MRTLIVGAGIGGLAAARGLLAAGHEVTVLERAPALRLGGGGITLWGGGPAVLDDLGIDLEGTGRHLSSIEARTAAGRLIWTIDTERTQGSSGAQARVVPRRDILLRLFQELPEGTVHFGTRFARLDDQGDHVEVQTDDGAVHTADLLIGADGVRSGVRAALWGPAPPPVTGIVSWQGLIPVPFDLGSGALLMIGREGDAGLAPAGDGLVQWFLDVPWKPGMTWDDPLSMLRRRYGKWAAPIPALLDALSQVELEPYPHNRLKVPRRWGKGRCILLGDAAHAMPPTLALGANQALEDVWVLLRCLATDPSSAARTYGNLRRRPASRASLVATRSVAVTGPQTLFQTEGQMRMASVLLPTRVANRAITGLHRSISNRLQEGFRPTPVVRSPETGEEERNERLDAGQRLQQHPGRGSLGPAG